MNMISCNVHSVSPMVFPISWGVSEGADVIQRKTEEIKGDLARSMTFGDRMSKVLEDLFELKRECSADNWDGHEAKSVDELSFQNSVRLALSMPVSVPIPNTYVDPDGEVAFEWYEGKRNVFSFSVGSNNRLSYAGLYGASKTFGVEYFYEDMPETILENINKLY